MSFHSRAYIEKLQTIDDNSSPAADECGLAYDCPFFEGLFDWVKWTTGATLNMADCLINGSHQISINWFGGWHHAQRNT
jgi:histone deacetylase 8